VKCGKWHSMAALALMILPLLASAQESESAVPATGSWWFEVGLGESLLHSASADGGGSTFNLGTGWVVAPNWALGLELGYASNRDGCEFYECGDFGPDVSHSLLVAEFIPARSAWRPRVAAGTFDYCTASTFFGCVTSKTGTGIGVYATRQWALTQRKVWSAGLRFGVEVAHFPAMHSTAIPAFWHTAAQLSVQIRRN
jgi:hypothetical protein